jgi:signal transduction histidine kinase
MSSTIGTRRVAGPPARGGTSGRRAPFGAAIMAACVVISVFAAPGTAAKVAVALLGAAAELGILLGRGATPTRRAVLAVAVTIGSGFAITFLAPSGLGMVPLLMGTAMLPACMEEGPVRRATVAAVAIGFGVTIMVISHSPAGLLAGAGAWLIAERTVEHAALQAERDRAVALLAEVEASRQAQQEAAAVEERGRIAREMHDVLAHSLAGLSVQLQAVRAIAVRENAPAALTGPLDRAAQLARDGVQEARAAVGALRATPVRGVEHLETLVGGFPGEARIRITGRPGPLAPEAGHAVYRAVQEAMTNAARYATGSAIEVDVVGEDDEVRVAVRDHGLPAGRGASGVRGSGSGLRGMAERIEAVGGTLTAGPVPDGPGWRIVARVPTTRTAGAAAGGGPGPASGAPSGSTGRSPGSPGARGTARPATTHPQPSTNPEALGRTDDTGAAPTATDRTGGTDGTGGADGTGGTRGAGGRMGA